MARRFLNREPDAVTKCSLMLFGTRNKEVPLVVARSQDVQIKQGKAAAVRVFLYCNTTCIGLGKPLQHATMVSHMRCPSSFRLSWQDPFLPSSVRLAVLTLHKTGLASHPLMSALFEDERWGEETGVALAWLLTLPASPLDKPGSLPSVSADLRQTAAHSATSPSDVLMDEMEASLTNIGALPESIRAWRHIESVASRGSCAHAGAAYEWTRGNGENREREWIEAMGDSDGESDVEASTLASGTLQAWLRNSGGGVETEFPFAQFTSPSSSGPERHAELAASVLELVLFSPPTDDGVPQFATTALPDPPCAMAYDSSVLLISAPALPVLM